MLIAFTREDGLVAVNRMEYDASDNSYRVDFDADWGDTRDWALLEVPEIGMYEGKMTSDVIESETYEEEDGTITYAPRWSWQVIPETRKEEVWLRDEVLESREQPRVQETDNPARRRYRSRDLIAMAFAVMDAGQGWRLGPAGASGASAEEIVKAYKAVFPERDGVPPSEWERER